MKKLFTTLLLLVGFFPAVISQTLKFPAEVEANIKKRIEAEQNPSIVVGIIDKDGPRYYNFGNVKIGGAPANEHSIYEIGSITKVFTATLLAQQVLDGKMKLDDPVQKYLPKEVRVPQRGGKEILLGNLSDHTSGLPRMPSNFNPANPRNPFADYTVEQLYAFLSTYELTRDIGSAYEYSNLAQGLLGHVLSLNAGESYESLVIKTIASPLKMKETKIALDDNMKKNLAIGYSAGVAVENWDIPTLAGAGAIRSSTFDMLRFLTANMGLEKSPLYPAMKMTHEVRHDKAGAMRVGLGWHIAKGKNGDVFWHNGGTGGYRTFAGFVKETSTGVVVLTNSAASVDDIGFHLLNPDAPLAEIAPSTVADVPESVLETYVGTYALAPTFNIDITRSGKQLFAQATGQAKFEIFAKTATEFYLKVVAASVTFNTNGQQVESLTLHQNGQNVPGKKIK